MLIHAHPDDECITTGGALARYAAEGVRTVLIIATGGEEGEIVVPELNTPANLARLHEIRDEELACATKQLNVAVLERLGYRDSGMLGTPANQHPACFHMVDKEEATGRLVKLIRQHRPQVLATYDERGGYGHPDHLACHQVTVAAFAAAGDAQRFPEAGPPWAPSKLYYTAFPRGPLLRAWTVMRDRGMQTPLDNPDFDIGQFTIDDALVTTTIAIHPYIAQKRAAIACHVTQIRTDGPFLAMPDDIAADVFGQEYFTLAASRLAAVPSENDLFMGVRAENGERRTED